MYNKREELREMLKKFISMCDDNDIWYALDKASLLGVVRHGGFIPWDIRMQVMMSLESYNKFKRLFDNNLIDSSENFELESLSGFFVNDKENITEEQPYIEIRILVPTTVKKLSKVRSSLYPLKNKIAKRRINTKNVINDLYSKRFEGYFLLESRKTTIKNAWIQSFKFHSTKRSFNGIEVNIPKNYQKILSEWYGEDYMKAVIPRYEFIYSSPMKIIRKEL